MSIPIAHRERVKQQPDVRSEQDLIRDELVGGDVIGLRLDAAAEEHVRRGERAQRLEARNHVIGDAVHDLVVLAVHFCVQAAEVRQSRGSARAAEETVALDEDRGAPCSAHRRRRGDARGPAAEHHHLVLGEHRRVALRLADEHTIELCKRSCASLPRG